MLEKWFKLKAYGTDVRTEVTAGATTFFTMVYIVIVNPAILSGAGVPFQQVFTATIVAVIIGTLTMALFANHPIAIAPGMGMNAYFTSVVAAYGISYQVAFGTVFAAGVLFLLLTFTRLRELLIDSIPPALKYGITGGIGLFIAFIGLKYAGLVIANESTMVTLGNLKEPITVLSICGLLLTLVLMSRGLKGALFIGMAVTAAAGYFMGLLKFHGVVAWPQPPVLFDLDIFGVFQHGLYTVVFAFLLVAIFDTTGTMIGVAEQAGIMKDGKLPRAKQALFADALATTAGSVLGTTPCSAYVESSAGVAAGGRTGLTTLTVSIFFLLSLFFSPLIESIASLSAITSPALIVVGCFMMEGLAHVRWKQFDEAFPAFAIMIMMPLTSSIATGIAIGFITYPLLKLFNDKGKEVHPILYVFGVIFAIQMVFFPAH